MRTLTARQKAALRDPFTTIANVVEIGHPSGTVYVWSGVGTLEYGGNEYIGCGLIGTIGGIEQGSDPRINEVIAAMAGVPSDVLGLIDADLKGREMSIYQALLTPDGRVIDDLLPVDVVDLDTQDTTADDDGTFIVSVRGQSGFWQLEKASLALWSPEQQKKDYAGDTGMDALATLEDLIVTWTRT